MFSAGFPRARKWPAVLFAGEVNADPVQMWRVTLLLARYNRRVATRWAAECGAIIERLELATPPRLRTKQIRIHIDTMKDLRKLARQIVRRNRV